MAVAFAIAALAGLAGSQLGDKGPKRRTVRARGRFANEQIRATNELFGGLQENELRGGLAASLAGFDAATAQVGGIASARKGATLQRERETATGIKQGLASSGLLTGNIGAQVDASLAQRTDRTLASIDADIAGLFSDLAIGRGQAEAAGRGALANFFASRGAQERDLGQKEFELLTGIGTQGGGGDQSVDLSGLVSILGLLGGGGGDSRTVGGSGLNSLGNSPVAIGPVA